MDGEEAPPRRCRTGLVAKLDDPEEQVRAWMRERLPGCELPERIVWMRLGLPHDPRARAMLAVLHSFVMPGEAELLVIADRGAITRSVLRVLSAWAFRHAAARGLLRVAVRIPLKAADVVGLARRAGFRNEGVSRGHYPDGTDAIVLGMTPMECPWLLASAPIDADASPAPSDTRH